MFHRIILGRGSEPAVKFGVRPRNAIFFLRHNAPLYFGGSQAFVSDSQAFVSGSQAFVNDSQDFVGVSQDFVNGSHDFVNGSHDFVGGSQAFLNGSQDFVSDSQDFVSGSQAFVSGSQELCGAWKTAPLRQGRGTICFDGLFFLVFQRFLFSGADSCSQTAN
jgi:hypothetical protein